MKKFIEIYRIKYESYWDKNPFGYVVYDIETKEIKYFSFYDHKRIHTPNMLHEFDPLNTDPNYYINWFDLGERYKRMEVSPVLPEELVNYKNSAIELHRTFNKENHLPTEHLDDNQKFLALRYDKCFLIKSYAQLAYATYNPIGNSIEFHVSKSDWSVLPDEVKKQIKDTCIHEVGHMKVTNHTLDEKNNKLYSQTGFSHSSMDIEQIKTDDGNVVFTLGKYDFNKNEEIQQALEEITNEVDCLLVSKYNYDIGYPIIGNSLNRLFNGNLINLRYTATINDLVAYLKEIIPSEDMAYEFLNTLVNYSYDGTNKEATEKVLSFISKYEKQKNK